MTDKVRVKFRRRKNMSNKNNNQDKQQPGLIQEVAIGDLLADQMIQENTLPTSSNKTSSK